MVEYKTGVAVPLASLRTEESPVVGEFSSLFEFADFAAKSGLSVIQLLPVLDTGTHSSPYSSLSAFALHPLYIKLSAIPIFKRCYESDSLFKKKYDEFISHKKDTRFDYEYVVNAKDFLLRKMWAVAIFAGDKIIVKNESKFYSFIEKNSDWLPFYCVFKFLKHQYLQASWKTWAKNHRNLSKSEILAFWNEESLQPMLLFYAWEQYVAFMQFKTASTYVKRRGITLKGDFPILLNEDSCDVWAFPEVFDTRLRAGSPPDGDNPTGQNWGFPCYDFDSQEKDGFSWWRLRIRLASEFFGAYRLDHIPGFFRLWSVPDGERTAEMGHTVPYSAISEKSLIKAGFSEERIRWLSQPHIPTEDFIRLVGDISATREILGTLCERIGREELWLFKPSIKSESEIYKLNLDKYDIDKSIQVEIFARLSRWWKNRTLIEISKNKFLPLWKYGETVAWASLSEAEKSALQELFAESAKKQEKLWQNQAEKIFSALVSSSKMQPCGEDLGVFIPCMEETLDKFGIFGLKVFRWCREWEKEYQPYIDIRTYRTLSIATTSVHDSSTLRERYEEEMKHCPFDTPSLSEEIFFGAVPDKPILEKSGKRVEFSKNFDPKIAEMLLSTYAKTSAAWFIPPLQDWLYLDSKYYAKDAKTERINIPGTVNDFNWTWRMSVNVEKLLENEKLCGKIKKIVEIHAATSKKSPAPVPDGTGEFV